MTLRGGFVVGEDRGNEEDWSNGVESDTAVLDEAMMTCYTLEMSRDARLCTRKPLSTDHAKSSSQWQHVFGRTAAVNGSWRKKATTMSIMHNDG